MQKIDWIEILNKLLNHNYVNLKVLLEHNENKKFLIPLTHAKDLLEKCSPIELLVQLTELSY